MFEKLEWMLKRFEELTALISDPDVIADRDKWQQLVKEHSQMQGTIELYKKYLDLQKNIEECKEIISDGSDEINKELEAKIDERLTMAGIEVIEARINYLAYAPEIAAVMLRRQQATAIIAAREKIVEGAVSMVKMALDKLSTEEIVELDEEKKAAMVSNLLVVLCGDDTAQPVINTGTIYQ